MNASEKSGVRFEGSSGIEELRISGDWAYARARLKVRTTPLQEGGETVSRSGYTLTIFQKERDGVWRIARNADHGSDPSGLHGPLHHPGNVSEPKRQVF